MRPTMIMKQLGQLDRSQTIGFIGLGAMGNHMLNNLVTRSAPTAGEKKPNFVVYDVNKIAISGVMVRHAVENPGVVIHASDSAEEVATYASTIISMVPTSKHVRDVYLGNNSVLTALKKLSPASVAETLCLDQSTIEQSISQSVALQMRNAGAEMMDAPVSGGVVGARDGTLAIMTGGSTDAHQRALPVLQCMARKVVHCGDLGAGLAAKIANNLLLGITMMGLSEAMLLGKNLGLSSQVLADIINTSTGRCWSSKVNNPVPSVNVENSSPPAQRSYVGGFVTKLAHKDLNLAVEAAHASGTPLALGKLTEQIYRPLANSRNWGNLDFSVIYKYLEEGMPGRMHGED